MFRSKRLAYSNQAALVAVIGMSGLCFPESSGGDLFVNRQRVATRCCIPNHNYQHNSFPFTVPDYSSATAIAVASTDPTVPPRRYRPFHFRESDLTVDHLTLDQVGISLLPSGEHLVATGRINHSGGGGLIGNHVTVRLRAFVSHEALLNDRMETAVSTRPSPAEREQTELIATPNEVTRIPADAVRVWQGERTFWVSRNGPQHVVLTPESISDEDSQLLCKYFRLITHLQVEVGYRTDR